MSIRIPDKRVRELLKRDAALARRVSPYRPDGAFYARDGIPTFVEYENSSRGLVTHVSKYIHSLGKDVARVILLRSPHHTLNHGQDFVLSLAVQALAPNIHWVNINCADERNLVAALALYE
jgi:hypothetical protein